MLSACGAGPANNVPFTIGADAPPPILPVLKITGSTDYYRCRANRIDFDAGTLIAGKEPADRAAQRLIRLIAAVASGRQNPNGTGAGISPFRSRSVPSGVSARVRCVLAPRANADFGNSRHPGRCVRESTPPTIGDFRPAARRRLDAFLIFPPAGFNTILTRRSLHFLLSMDCKGD